MTNVYLQRLIKEIRMLHLNTANTYRYLTDKAFVKEIHEKMILSPQIQLSLSLKELEFCPTTRESELKEQEDSDFEARSEGFEKLLVVDDKGDKLLDFTRLLPIEGINSLWLDCREIHSVKLGNITTKADLNGIFKRIIVTSNINSLEIEYPFLDLDYVPDLEISVMGESKINHFFFNGGIENQQGGLFVINPPTAFLGHSLRICNSEITDFGPFRNIIGLELAACPQLQDLSIFQNFSCLMKVNFKHCSGITDLSMLSQVKEFEMTSCNNVIYFPSVFEKATKVTISNYEGNVASIPEMPMVREVAIHRWLSLKETSFSSPYLKVLKLVDCDKLEKVGVSPLALLDILDMYDSFNIRLISAITVRDLNVCCYSERSVALAIPLEEVITSLTILKLGKVKNSNCFIPFLLTHSLERLDLISSNIPLLPYPSEQLLIDSHNCLQIDSLYSNLMQLTIKNCGYLTSITVPSSVKKLALINLPELSTIEIPDSSQPLHLCALAFCKKLTAVTFHRVLKTLKIRCCSKLKKVLSKGSLPHVLEKSLLDPDLECEILPIHS